MWQPRWEGLPPNASHRQSRGCLGAPEPLLTATTTPTTPTAGSAGSLASVRSFHPTASPPPNSSSFLDILDPYWMPSPGSSDTCRSPSQLLFPSLALLLSPRHIPPTPCPAQDLDGTQRRSINV